MVWNYYDDDIPSTPKDIELTISSLPAKKVRLSHFRIDDEHSNSYEVWKKMGSPQIPAKEQTDILEKAGGWHTIENTGKLKVRKGNVLIRLRLPGQGVSLLKLDW